MYQKLTSVALAFVLALALLPTSAPAAAAKAPALSLSPPGNFTVALLPAVDRDIPDLFILRFDIPEEVRALARDSRYTVGYAIDYKIGGAPWYPKNDNPDRGVNEERYETPFLSLELEGLPFVAVGASCFSFYQYDAIQAKFQAEADLMMLKNRDEDFWNAYQTTDYFGFSAGDTYTFRARFFAYKNSDSESDAWQKSPVNQLSPYTTEIKVPGLGVYGGSGQLAPPGGFWGKASPWAEPELRRGLAHSFIPNTLMGADLTQRITRGEFAALVLGIYDGVDGRLPLGRTGEYPFTDRSAYYEYDAWNAYQAGITAGVGGGRFGFDAPITRQEVAAMLLRTVKAAKTDLDGVCAEDFTVPSPASFTDAAQIAPWAKAGADYLTSLGILQGANGAFLPLGSCSREQALVIAERLYHIYSIHNGHTAVR